MASATCWSAASVPATWTKRGSWPAAARASWTSRCGVEGGADEDGADEDGADEGCEVAG
jgi:hypothetical protein